MMSCSDISLALVRGGGDGSCLTSSLPDCLTSTLPGCLTSSLTDCAALTVLVFWQCPVLAGTEAMVLMIGSDDVFGRHWQVLRRRV